MTTIAFIVGVLIGAGAMWLWNKYKTKAEAEAAAIKKVL